MAAHIEVEPCAVGEEHVARPTPRHHPAEQIARHLVGAQPPLAAQREGDPVLVLEPEDPPLHRCNLPPPRALPRARQLRCPNGYRASTFCAAHQPSGVRSVRAWGALAASPGRMRMFDGGWRRGDCLRDGCGRMAPDALYDPCAG